MTEYLNGPGFRIIIITCVTAECFLLMQVFFYNWLIQDSHWNKMSKLLRIGKKPVAAFLRSLTLLIGTIIAVV